VQSLDVDAIRQFDTEFGDRMFLIPQIGYMQLYESCWPVMGQTRWAYYSQKDPDFIHQLIESRKQAQIQILDEIARLKPHIVFGGDDLGQKGRSLVSPAWFDKFLAQPYTELFTKLHEELGAKIVNHSCGNITELLPQLVSCGLDGWQSLEPLPRLILRV
jgi:uroporphyrinogen decarboxylase